MTREGTPSVTENYHLRQAGNVTNRLFSGPFCRGHCQTNLTEPAKGADLKRSGCQLTPFRECGSAVLFEDVAAVEVAVEVEMVVD